MKNSEIDPAILSDAELARFVERADQLLNRELGESGRSVSAQWRMVNDVVGRGFVVLELSDGDVKTYDAFTADDLKNESQAGLEMVRSWGKYLKGKSSKISEQIRSAANQASEV